MSATSLNGAALPPPGRLADAEFPDRTDGSRRTITHDGFKASIIPEGVSQQRVSFNDSRNGSVDENQIRRSIDRQPFID